MTPDILAPVTPDDAQMPPELIDALDYSTGQWNTRIAGLERSFADEQMRLLSASDYDQLVSTYNQQYAALVQARDAAVARAKRAASPQAAAVADADAAGNAAYNEVMSQVGNNPAGAAILHAYAVDSFRRDYAAAYRRAGGKRDIGGPVTAELLDADLQPPRFPGKPGVMAHDNQWMLLLRGVKPAELNGRDYPMFQGLNGILLRSVMAAAEEPVETYRVHRDPDGKPSGDEQMFVEMVSPLPRRLQGIGQTAGRAILSRARLLDEIEVGSNRAKQRGYSQGHDSAVGRGRHDPSITNDDIKAAANLAGEQAKQLYLEQHGMLSPQTSPLQRLADAAINKLFRA